VLTGAGSTGSVLLVDPEKVVVANVGDSSAVLVRNGQHKVLSTAHRVYGGCAPLPLVVLCYRCCATDVVLPMLCYQMLPCKALLLWSLSLAAFAFDFAFAFEW
jgi:hypothetical protein